MNIEVWTAVFTLTPQCRLPFLPVRRPSTSVNLAIDLMNTRGFEEGWRGSLLPIAHGVSQCPQPSSQNDAVEALPQRQKREVVGGSAGERSSYHRQSIRYGSCTDDRGLYRSPLNNSLGPKNCLFPATGKSIRYTPSTRCPIGLARFGDQDMAAPCRSREKKKKRDAACQRAQASDESKPARSRGS